MNAFSASNPPASPLDTDVIDFKSKSFLIVDDVEGMRNSMRLTVATFGGVKIDLASDALTATKRLEQTRYDIVICDYHLGQGRDGQQLLEDLKRRRLLPYSTIFMMVTAENSYQKVVSAVELAPDDYIIKPFTGETLKVRLERLIHKKQAFEPVYALMEKEAYNKALAECEELAQCYPPYRIEALRLKGEILLLLGDYIKARALYQQILDVRSIPWARMGLAKAHYHEGTYEVAEEMLAKLVSDAPDYMEAYDWLAKTQSAQGQDENAKETLVTATGRSPRTLHRQKGLGETAYRTKDLDTAQASFKTVLDIGKYSTFVAPEDYANLGRVYVDQNKCANAIELMDSAKKSFAAAKDTAVQKEAELFASVIHCKAHKKMGNEKAAADAYAKAVELFDSTDSPRENLALDLADVAFAMGDAEKGTQIAHAVVQANHSDKAVLKQAEAMFEKAGRLEEGKALIADSSKEVIGLNNQAVKMAQSGDLKGAMEILMDAAERLPGNTTVVLNAVHSMLAYMEKFGFERQAATLAKQYMDDVKRRDPANPKLIKLREMFKTLADKGKSNAES